MQAHTEIAANWAAWGPAAIRQYRIRHALTQSDLAARVGVNPMSIHRWETGDSVPRAKFIRAIRVVLGLPS